MGSIPDRGTKIPDPACRTARPRKKRKKKCRIVIAEGATWGPLLGDSPNNFYEELMIPLDLEVTLQPDYLSSNLSSSTRY